MDTQFFKAIACRVVSSVATIAVLDTITGAIDENKEFYQKLQDRPKTKALLTAGTILVTAGATVMTYYIVGNGLWTTLNRS